MSHSSEKSLDAAGIERMIAAFDFTETHAVLRFDAHVEQTLELANAPVTVVLRVDAWGSRSAIG